MVSSSHIKGFTIINSALPFGNNQDEYSDFQENGAKFRDRCKQNGIQFQATWYTTLII